MKRLILIRDVITYILLFSLSIGSTNAQKQPQIQEISVRAPENIKIDGKLNEWANPLLNAYNAANRLYYVISNDDKNLYITMRGMGARVARKALEGGLAVTISHSLEKKTKAKAPGNVTVMFPVPQEQKTIFSIISIVNTLNGLIIDRDSLANRKQIDSIVAIANKRIGDAMKEIRVTGVKDIADSVISVYNTTGIKAAAQFIKRQPVIEIAIPLKYLGLSIDNPVKFSYNIKLSGLPLGPGVNIDDEMTPDDMYLLASTDLWGEYILIKKPGN
jgi:hypothetical protein